MEVHYVTLTWEATTEDFTFGSGVVTFAIGETEKRVRVATTEDGISEGEERMILDLVYVAGADVEDREGTGTISDG